MSFYSYYPNDPAKSRRNAFYYETYCLDPKWQRRWIWISLLFLGPCAFLAGLTTGRRAGKEPQSGTVTQSNSTTTSMQYVFLQTDQTISSLDPSICFDDSQSGNNHSSYCLKLQSNGNLWLYQQHDDKRALLWSSQVEKETGNYTTRLQSDGNLVTIQQATGLQVWATQSKSTKGSYQLVLDIKQRGMQIEREGQPHVVLWSTASTLDQQGEDRQDTNDYGGDAMDANNGDDDAVEPTADANDDDDGDYFVWIPQTPTTDETITTEPTSTSPPVTAVEEEGSTSIPWTSASWSSQYSLRSGPMVGHITDQSVRLWALQGQSKAMELVYRTAGASMAYSMLMPPNADQGATMVTVPMLQPNTQYEYQIRIQGETVGEGVWTTASPSFQATQFKFLLASCMDVKSGRQPQQPVWDQVLQLGQPDFAMLNGDTVYLNEDDWTSTSEVILDRVWIRNLDQRNETHFKNFIAKVPTYSVWDDHEFGSNNANMNQPGKYNSLRAFTHLWVNPGAGTSSLEGVFYSFYRGDVHFIVCDNRWYRDPSTGSQWGPAQIGWIADQLLGSVGVFKIIVTGGDVMQVKWSTDMDAIGRFVTDHGISGVLVCAGDIHRNEFKAVEHNSWPYKLVQISSSGIARVWRRPWAIIHVDTTSSDPFVTVHFYGAESESQTTSWGNDPNLRCTSLTSSDLYLEHRCTETVLLSSLTPS